MAWYPQSSVGLNYISYPVGPIPVGLTLTAGAINTKGAYAELISATPFTCNSVRIMICNTVTASGRFYLFDLSTGPGGSETVAVPNIPTEGSNTATGSICTSGLFTVPLGISIGTRVALRAQCTVAAATMNVQVILVAAGGVVGVSSVLNYGSDITTSLGLSIDPGAVASTKGAYTEITSSTSAIIQWLSTLFLLAHATPTNTFWQADLSTGPGGSETVLIPDIFVANAGTIASIQPKSYEFLVYIALATRIAMRASCTSSTATTRLLTTALLATVAPAEPTGNSGGSFVFTS